MSTIERAAPITSAIPISRILRLWQGLRDRGIAFFLAALAVFCCAAIPLNTSTRRTYAEFQIGALQQEILRKQENKAQLVRDVSDRLRLDTLEKSGKQLGMTVPVSVEYLTVP